MQSACQEQLPLGSDDIEPGLEVVEIVLQEETTLLAIRHVPDHVALMVTMLFDKLLLHSKFLDRY
jgi:hypothetical protein